MSPRGKFGTMWSDKSENNATFYYNSRFFTARGRTRLPLKNLKIETVYYIEAQISDKITCLRMLKFDLKNWQISRELCANKRYNLERKERTFVANVKALVKVSTTRQQAAILNSWDWLGGEMRRRAGANFGSLTYSSVAPGASRNKLRREFLRMISPPALKTKRKKYGYEIKFEFLKLSFNIKLLSNCAFFAFTG